MNGTTCERCGRRKPSSCFDMTTDSEPDLCDDCYDSVMDDIQTHSGDVPEESDR